VAPASWNLPAVSRAAEGEGGGDHQRTRAQDHDDGAEDRVQPLVGEPLRGDPLVDHVGLLEEELPGRDRRPHDAHDQQQVRAEPAWQLRHQAAGDRGRVGVRHQGERDGGEVEGDEDVHEALPTPEAAGDRDRHQARGEEHGQGRVDAEVDRDLVHPDELGDDGQEVEEEQVADRERAPEPAEALDDQPRVADACHGAQAGSHLLVHNEHGDQQREGPEQADSVILARLGVGGDAAGVVVADHDDQPRAEDGEQGQEAAEAAGPCRAVADGAQRPEDVAPMSLVEVGRANSTARVLANQLVERHLSPPCLGIRGGSGDHPNSGKGTASAQPAWPAPRTQATAGRSSGWVLSGSIAVLLFKADECPTSLR
jgi:hypothetical protein